MIKDSDMLPKREFYFSVSWDLGHGSLGHIKSVGIRCFFQSIEITGFVKHVHINLGVLNNVRNREY